MAAIGAWIIFQFKNNIFDLWYHTLKILIRIPEDNNKQLAKEIVKDYSFMYTYIVVKFHSYIETEYKNYSARSIYTSTAPPTPSYMCSHS